MDSEEIVLDNIINEETTNDINKANGNKAIIAFAISLISFVFPVVGIRLALRMMSISLIFAPIGVIAAIVAFRMGKLNVEKLTGKLMLSKIARVLAVFSIIFGVLASLFVYSLYSEECCGIREEFGGLKCTYNSHDISYADYVHTALYEVLRDPALLEYNNFVFQDCEIPLEDFIDQLSPELQEAFFEKMECESLSDIYKKLKGKSSLGWYSDTGMYVRIVGERIEVCLYGYEEYL